MLNNLIKRCGEGADVSEKLVDDYRSRIPSIISGNNETEVFNCDETWLFYRAMPDKTLGMQLEVERWQRRGLLCYSVAVLVERS